MTAAPPNDPVETDPPRTEVWKMFDRIAHRYDILNRSLSFGQDVAWRRRLRKHLPDRSDLHILDLATGTADQLIFLAGDPRVATGEGSDLAEKMLEIGRRKLVKAGLQDRFTLRTGDALHVPAADQSADVVTISFGIRNVESVPTAMQEMYRVLKPGGRVLILEFALPGNRLMRSLYLFYFRHILPRIGGLISGDSYAYRYLNRTVESFPYGDAFCDWMREAGFESVGFQSLTFGIAAIYQGDKPPQPNP